MTTLILSQIIFNFVASIAIITISVLIGIIAFDIIKFTKSIKNFFNNLNEKSNELYKNLDNFFAGISTLPFISGLFKKKRKSK
ncbi:MAG: hypothetical protein Q8O66_01070 [bacterium]|nr:hypothetical protein [bacterium]